MSRGFFFFFCSFYSFLLQSRFIFRSTEQKKKNALKTVSTPPYCITIVTISVLVSRTKLISSLDEFNGWPTEKPPADRTVCTSRTWTYAVHVIYRFRSHLLCNGVFRCVVFDRLSSRPNRTTNGRKRNVNDCNIV